MIEYPPPIPPLPDDYTPAQLQAWREAMRARGWEIQRLECEEKGDKQGADFAAWMRDGMPATAV